MGPNGCGKTTLLDNVMAIHKPGAGKIDLMGAPLQSYKRLQIARHIAYVPQTHQIAFPYTVWEVVLMGRTAHMGAFGSPQPEDEDIALAALEKTGMAYFADTPYDRLSGGEVKLVLLARALGQQTALLVMDEPAAHLDLKNELLFLETFARLCREEHIAVLMATHSPSHPFFFEGKGLDCRTAMMGHGKILACGRPEDTVTAETIRQVYGVQAKITEENSGGMRMKAVIAYEAWGADRRE
jgi:iron complex transport system ATP-binding protein